MTVNKKSVPADIHEDIMLTGGRWIAYAGFAYVFAWLIGLAIGLATSAPGSTDSNSTLGVYFSSHRQVTMIQAYLLDGIAGISLIVFAAALHSALHRFEGDTYKLLALGVFLGAAALLIFRTHALPGWLGWIAAVLAPLLVVAGWNFVLSSSIQFAAYAVPLLVLLVWVVAVSVVSLRRAK